MEVEYVAADLKDMLGKTEGEQEENPIYAEFQEVFNKFQAKAEGEGEENGVGGTIESQVSRGQCSYVVLVCLRVGERG